MNSFLFSIILNSTLEPLAWLLLHAAHQVVSSMSTSFLAQFGMCDSCALGSEDGNWFFIFLALSFRTVNALRRAHGVSMPLPPWRAGRCFGLWSLCRSYTGTRTRSARVFMFFFSLMQKIIHFQGAYAMPTSCDLDDFSKNMKVRD